MSNDGSNIQNKDLSHIHLAVLLIRIIFTNDYFFVKLQKGLKNVFDEAILAALEPPEQKPRRRCCLF